VNGFKKVTVKLNFICIYNCESDVFEGWVLGTLHVAATTEFSVWKSYQPNLFYH
jgi:hypothetical protein